MATAAEQISDWPRPAVWLRDFLRKELAPYPGRGMLVARMVVAVSIVMILTMTLRIPDGAFGAMYALMISRENPKATLQDVKNLALSFIAGAAVVLLGAVVFSAEPMLRVVWDIALFFGLFYSLRALSSYAAAARFGYVVMIAVPVWDKVMTDSEKVDATLWAVAAILLASVVTAVVEFVFATLKPGDSLVDAISERLETIEALLRARMTGMPDPALEQNIDRYAMLGTSRMRRDLERSGYSPRYAEDMGAVVAFVGRLMDIAANLTHFSSRPVPPEGRARLETLIENVAGIRSDLLNGNTPRLRSLPDQADVLAAVPLLREAERTVSLIAGVFSGEKSLGPFAHHLEPEQPPNKLFVSDAFSNPEYIRFALKGCLAATICYLTYNLIDWPQISTCVITCLVTALSTVGSSRQRQLLRFGGAFFGGAVGMLAQIFLLPGIDTIFGFLLFFIAVSIVAAWISTSGPRLSYFGIQMAIAFYLTNLQEFQFQTSLSIAWDRVVGVLFGLFVMWVVFDQLWGASAIVEMRRSFISSLRLMAQFAREPLKDDTKAALEHSYALRKTINTNFETLREAADGVMLEFGPDRLLDLASRGQILHWQLQLRLIFIARVALFKYRLQLPGFELAQPIQESLRVFDQIQAEALDGIADRMEGRTSPPHRDLKATFDSLQQVVQSCCPALPVEMATAQTQTFLPLARRTESLTRSLDHAI